jgi:hypothetical protein
VHDGRKDFYFARPEKIKAVSIFWEIKSSLNNH